MLLLLESMVVLVEAILGDYRLVEMSDGCHGSITMFSSNSPNPPFSHTYTLPFSSYLVTNLMGADLNNIVKFQRLSDEHVQFLIYQLLRGLKVIYYVEIYLLHAILNTTYCTYILYFHNPVR